MFSVRYYVIAAVLVFLGKVAFAGVLIEPYIGYSLAGKIDDKEVGDESKSDYSGLNLGGRLGFQYLGLMGGFAYDHGSYETELTGPQDSVDSLKSAGITMKDKWSANSYGAFVGYNFPILLRVWGTYFFSSKWTDQDNGSTIFTKDSEFRGSAYELGLGYTALPFLSLNAQYRVTNFDKSKDASDGSTATVKDTSVNSFILSVSLPINL